MNVDPNDAVCRNCGGPLQIIDAGKTSVTVACVECSDTFEMEIAPRLRAPIVPFNMMAECLMEETDGSERHPA